MDKGVKGLLSGDLSVPILKQIEASITKYELKFNKLSSAIQNQIDKQDTLQRFMSTHFEIENLSTTSNVY